MKYKISKTSFSFARKFVNQYHRHLYAPAGHKYSLTIYNENTFIGVIMCGRPINRHLAAAGFIEFNRVCVREGFPNACSQLLAAARKFGKQNGHSKFITYIREDENGASLKADNWKYDGFVKGRQWHMNSPYNLVNKKRFIHL